MNKKIIIVPALALALAGLYTGVAKAEFFGPKHEEMVSTLSQKLGVSEDKVTAAFDDLHTERQAEIKVMHEQRLQALFDDGKLTSAQKTALTAKMEEMRAKHEAERSEFEKWATDNGINLDEIGPDRR